MPGWGGWRCLPFCQPIDFIIHHYHCNIDIAQGGMYQVTSADAEEIAIAADRYNRQVGTRHFQPLRQGQGTTMHCMKAKGLDKMRQTARAADTRYHNRLIGWQFEGRQGIIDRIQDAEVAAPWTPGRLHLTFKIFGSKSHC